MIKINTDAAVKGNPGPAAIGMVMQEDGQQTTFRQPLEGQMDNHEAELHAIAAAMTMLLDAHKHEKLIMIRSDSRFAISAIQKNYSKQARYQPVLQTIQTLKEHFPALYLEWIPEKQNKAADQLARQALRRLNV